MRFPLVFYRGWSGLVGGRLRFLGRPSCVLRVPGLRLGGIAWACWDLMTKIFLDLNLRGKIAWCPPQDFSFFLNFFASSLRESFRIVAK